MTQNNQTDTDFLFKEETDQIIGAFYKVYRTLGFGFLERVSQNALYYELVARGFKCKAQHPIQVFYEGVLVGEYIADIVVNDKIILELKANKALSVEYESQLLNYLKATQIELGLLLNFGQRPQIKRKIFRNDNK